MMIKMWHNGIAAQISWSGVFYSWSEYGDGWQKRLSQRQAKKEHNKAIEEDRVKWVKLRDNRGIDDIE